LETGLRLAKTGRTSVTYEIGFFAPGDEMEAARARFNHVCVNARTRRPVMIPETLQTALQSLAI
jgi:acyl-CoA thioester hydrolase